MSEQVGAPQRLAYFGELPFCPVEVCLRRERERCREKRVQVSTREGLILGKGAYGVTRESDVGESSAYCVISVPCAGAGLDCVDIRRDLTFGDMQVDATHRAKLLDYFQKRYHVLYIACDESPGYHLLVSLRLQEAMS